MKLGFYVGEKVAFEYDGKKFAGRIKEVGRNFVRFADAAGAVFKFSVVGDAAAVVVVAE